MSGDPLIRPVWSSLTGPQAQLKIAPSPALRMAPDIGPFAAAPDASAAGMAALRQAMALHPDPVLVVEAADFPLPPQCEVIEAAPLVQMVHSGAPLAPSPDDIVLLGAADWPEMAALAEATRPGPWRARTPVYGAYYGAWRGGRLVAMAGERMRPAPGLAEVSGVCTLPEYRGEGHAAALIGRVIAGFSARGDRAFLHCNAANAGAIRLYEALGFTVSREMVATVLALA